MTFSWLPGQSELNLQQDLLDTAAFAAKHYAATLDGARRRFGTEGNNDTPVVGGGEVVP